MNTFIASPSLPPPGAPARPHVSRASRSLNVRPPRNNTSLGTQPIRVSRKSEVIGKWRPKEIAKRLLSGDLLMTDSYYDRATSEWILCSNLPSPEAQHDVPQVARPPCYCGSGLPFRACCGLDDNY